MNHALNAKELDAIKRFAMQKLADVNPEVNPEVDHLDWSDKVDGAIDVNEHYLLSSKLNCFPSTSSTTEQAVKQGKSQSNNNNGSPQNISDGVLLSSCLSFSLFNLATKQGMYDEYMNVEGANIDLYNATEEKREQIQDVKSRKSYLAAVCYLFQVQTDDMYKKMAEVKEAWDRLQESEHVIEDMIADATKNEILQRNEKNKLIAEKQESCSSLKKRTILCKKLIKPEHKIAMAWSFAIEGKKAVTSLCSWAALTPELIARGINFHTNVETNKKNGTIPMLAAKQLLREHEDCVDGVIELKGKYDNEDVQEVQVVFNEDIESLLDNVENGAEEMGVALEDNEGNGEEQIVNE